VGGVFARACADAEQGGGGNARLLSSRALARPSARPSVREPSVVEFSLNEQL